MLKLCPYYKIFIIPFHLNLNTHCNDIVNNTYNTKMLESTELVYINIISIKKYSAIICGSSAVLYAHIT